MRLGTCLALGTALTACGGGSLRREYAHATFESSPDTVLTRYASVPVGAWLGGDRWLVVSQEYDEAILIDFSTGTSRVLRGSSTIPVEHPSAVFSFADTGYVADWARAVTVQVTRDGAVVGEAASPTALRGTRPSARDAAGRFYFEVRPPPRQGGEGNRDSAAVVRATADLVRFDTVARLTPLDQAEVEDEGGRRFERRVFSGTDRWGVFPDGTVWVARVYGNYLEWSGPDRERRRGPGLPDRIIEVTSTDRQHWLLQFPEDLRSTAERIPISPLKPPFLEGYTAPAGDVWLEKSRAVTDTVRPYHIVAPDGTLRYIADLPMRQGHVIAVGARSVLIAEQYAEGVRLMQTTIPQPAVAPAEDASP